MTAPTHPSPTELITDIGELTTQADGESRRTNAALVVQDGRIAWIGDAASAPAADTRTSIGDVHYPDIKKDLVSEALDVFFDVRKVPGLKKKPSTSELVDWLKLLMADNIGEAVLRERDPTKAIPPLPARWRCVPS